MNILIKQKTVISLLLCTYAILLVCHLVALFCIFYLDKPNALGIVPIFHFNLENNLPTLFSGIQLWIGSLLALSIAFHTRATNSGQHRHWFAIAAILAYIGIDDVASIHEHVDLLMMARMETTGLIHWPWVIPYAILAFLIIIFFIPFFLKLPNMTKLLFATAAAMFLCGAIGCEMLGASHAENNGEGTLHYAILSTIEESLEMLAVMTAIAGLLHYMTNYTSNLSVTLAPAPKAA